MSSRNTSVRLSLALWPLALAGCVVLTFVRLAACHPDAASQGNAWTEDHNGYCTNSGWDALTAGGSGSLLALALIAVTAALPATVLVCGTAVAAARRDRSLAPRAYAAAAAVGGVLVMAFIVKWGHVSVVGGAGG